MAAHIANLHFTGSYSLLRKAVIDDCQTVALVEAGLVGLEVTHRENTTDGRERLLELAARFDLIVTVSSDYNSTGKPNRLVENTTEPEALESIVARTRGVPPVRSEAAHPLEMLG